MPFDFAAPDGSFVAELTRRSPAASTWLAELPARWQRCVTRWGLNQSGPIAYGRTSLVVPVTRDSGGRAALKLVSPVVSARDEMVALEAFGGDGAVALLDGDATEGTLLLEHLSGPSLTELDPVSAMAAAGEVVAGLLGTTAPPGTPTLASGAARWAGQLRDQQRVSEQSGTALPEPVVDRAVRIVEALADDPSTMLTHGDLSLDNIMGSSRGWLAIDPLLTAGTPEQEAHTVTRSCLSVAVAEPDPASTLRSWSDLFCRVAGLDAERAWQVSYARFVASYLWEAQHDGEPTRVAALRRASMAMAPTMG